MRDDNKHNDSIKVSSFYSQQEQTTQKNNEFQAQVNPKDLSNEELEYVIRTGKLPPKFGWNLPVTVQADDSPLQLNTNHKQNNSTSSVIEVLQQKVEQLGTEKEQLRRERDKLQQMAENQEIVKNHTLLEQVDQLKQQIRIMQAELSQSEREKQRHLEANTEDKVNLKQRILTLEDEVAQNKLAVKQRDDMASQLNHWQNQNESLKQENSMMGENNRQLKEQILKLEQTNETDRNRALQFKNDLQSQIELLRSEVDQKQKEYSKTIRKSKHQVVDLLNKNAKLEAELYACQQTISKYAKQARKGSNDSFSTQRSKIKKSCSDLSTKSSSQSKFVQKQKYSHNLSSKVLNKVQKPEMLPPKGKKGLLSEKINQAKENVISINSNLKTVQLQQHTLDSDVRNSISPNSVSQKLFVYGQEKLPHYQTHTQPPSKLTGEDVSRDLQFQLVNVPSVLNMSVGDQIFELERKIADLNHLYKLAQAKRDAEQMAYIMADLEKNLDCLRQLKNERHNLMHQQIFQGSQLIQKI